MACIFEGAQVSLLVRGASSELTRERRTWAGDRPLQLGPESISEGWWEEWSVLTTGTHVVGPQCSVLLAVLTSVRGASPELCRERRTWAASRPL